MTLIQFLIENFNFNFNINSNFLTNKILSYKRNLHLIVSFKVSWMIFTIENFQSIFFSNQRDKFSNKRAYKILNSHNCNSYQTYTIQNINDSFLVSLQTDQKGRTISNNLKQSTIPINPLQEIEISLPQFALVYAKPIRFRPTHEYNQLSNTIYLHRPRIETQNCITMKARGEVGKRGDWPIGFPYASSACDGPLLWTT